MPEQNQPHSRQGPARNGHQNNRGRGRSSSSRGDETGRRRAARSGRPERQKQEFEQRIIAIRRVARVVSGGRRFSFSVVMVIGDRKGRVGVGVGKGADTALAVEKAVRSARKNLLEVPHTKSMSLPSDVHARYAASDVVMAPAPGRGLVAGSSVRTVLELAGITDVSAKLLSRSKNKLNNARAALRALQSIITK